MIPKPPRTKRLWRYMNYERFVSMLERGTIYFTQPSQFEDKNEGLMSLDWQTMIALFDDGEQAHNDLTSQYPNIPSPPYISYSEWLEIFIYGREEYGVSCWHSNKSQSLAMWDLYVGKGKDGIAITTTFERLYNALIMYNSRLLIGAVEYLDLMGHKYLSHRLNERPKGVIKYHEESSSTPLDTLFRKDLSYNHENEVRAVIKLELDANKNLSKSCKYNGKRLLNRSLSHHTQKDIS